MTKKAKPIKKIDKRQLQEYKDSQRELMLGNHNAPKRKIVQKDGITGKEIEEFPSIMAATIKTGVSHGNIRSCLYGKTKTAGGYKWEDIKDEQNIK